MKRVVLVGALVAALAPDASAPIDWAAVTLAERARAAEDPAHQPVPLERAARLGPARIEGTGAHLGSVAIGLRAIGRADAMRELGAPPPSIAGPEVRIARAPGVIEWWRSLPSGLEQGVTLDARPPGEGALRLEMDIGDARAELRGHDAARLLDAQGAELARYAHLVVLDADGARVPARLVADGGLAIEVDDAAARYPLVVDPFVYVVRQAVLTAGDATDDDRLGAAVALDATGTRVIAGAPADLVVGGGQGTARVFSRTGTTWREEATLAPAGGAVGDAAGAAVAISGDGALAFVGVPTDDTGAGADAGTVRVFSRSGTTWSETALLEAPSSAAGDQFGAALAVSVDGLTLLVGAPRDDTPLGSDAGSVFVFTRLGSWASSATLQPVLGAAGDSFGTSLALSTDGTRCLVGAITDDVGTAVDAGSVTVFRLGGTTWAEEATLVHPTPAASDNFGTGVAISSDGARAAVGAERDDVGVINGGSVHVYDRSGTTWTVDPTLLRGSEAGDFLGAAVAISGDGASLAAGLPNAAMYDVGRVRLHARIGGIWGLDVTLENDLWIANFETFGEAIAYTADGAWLAVGNPNGYAGSVAVYAVARGLTLGAACSVDAQCLGGFCVDGVCCDGFCGGASSTDCLGCTMALTGLPSGTCSTLSASAAPTVECRAAYGGCDAAEHCEAGNATCPPPGGTLSAGTTCRAPAGACDVAEICDGSDIDCPPDSPAPSGTTCRAPAAGCDVGEVCDGASTACPADVWVPSGVLCRSAIGPCDVADRCTGASATCPADVVSPASVVCRLAVGPCDATESCDGTSPVCPSDTFLPATAVCNAITRGPCDAPDHCTGSTADCPAALLAGVECRAAAGSCDVAEICLGDSLECPPDGVEPSGMSCRPATAACDTAEVCDGTAGDCPADVTTCADPDAGSSADAGSASDAPAPDAGAGGPVAVAGCTCRAGARATPFGAVALLGLALLGLGRRHRRRDP